MATTGQAGPMTYGYVSTGELEMYYQIHGSGKPVLLLHGGLTTIESSFGSVIPDLAQTRTVIAVEQQGHGRTADIDRPMDFAQMADDTATVLRELRVDPIDVFGYSDGGNVALGLAIRHSELVQSLAVASANFSLDGLYPEFLEMMESASSDDMPDELREEYERVAPHPERWPEVVQKVMHLGTHFPGWSKTDLLGIKQPVLVIVGDRDIVKPDHALELYNLLPNGQLGILPGTDHGLNLESPALLMSMLTSFFGSGVRGADAA